MASAHYSSMLPSQLRLKLGGLDQEQLRIYEDFANPRDQAHWQEGGRHVEGETAMDELPTTPAAGVDRALRGSLSPAEATERINAIAAEIERVTDTLAVESLAQVPEDHELRGLLAEIPIVLNESAARDQTTMMCAQKIVATLFRSTTAIARDVFVTLLAHVCSLALKVAQEVSSWLVYAEDDVRPLIPGPCFSC